MLSRIQKKYNILFVNQNFELKTGRNAAAYIEVVKPMIRSGLVNRYRLLEFERTYEQHFKPILLSRLADIRQQVGTQPIVIYGAGIHTQQHWRLFQTFNIVAIADKQVALHGQTLFDLPIIAPEQINDYAQHVVISSKAFEDNIADELRIYALDTHKLYASPEAETRYYERMYQRITQQITEFQPDLLFYSPTHPQDNLPVAYWQRIVKQFPSLVTAMVWWDHDEQALTHSYLSFEKDCLTWVDVAFDAGNATRLEKMRAGLAPYQAHTNTHKAFFHPTVFDPDYFYYDARIPREQDIVTTGSIAGRRKAWIEFLMRQYPQQFMHIGGVAHGKRVMPISEYAAQLQRAKITVNTQTYEFRSDCKGKVREALACGTFLLEEYNPQTEAFIPEGTGYVFYRTEHELKEKLDYYLSHEAERLDIVAIGQVWLAQHFNAHWWTQRVISTAFNNHHNEPA